MIFEIFCSIWLSSTFNPDLWGTISDWFTAITTLITLIFIYKTLNSQKKVQKDQFELFKIESERFREEVKPEFEVDYIEVGSSKEVSTDEIHLIVFYLKKSTAKNIQLSITGKAAYKIKEIMQFRDPLPPNDGFMAYLERSGIETKITLGNIEHSIDMAGMSLKYSDAYNNYYEQRVNFMFRPKPRVSISSPMHTP